MENTLFSELSKKMSEKEKTSVCLIGELLDSANALPRRLNDVETLRFSLQELKQRSQALNSGGQQGLTKAHYLLMNSGINVEDIMGKLDKLAQRPTHQHHQPPKEEEIVIQPVIADDDEANFKEYVNANIQIDWKVRKRELRERISGVLKRDSSVSIEKDELKKPKDVMLKQLTWGNRNNKSLISSNFKFTDVVEPVDGLGNNPSPVISIKLRKKFESYASIIYSLNDARERKLGYPLCESFIDLNKKNKNGVNDQLIEALEIIRGVVDGDEFSGDLGEAYAAKDLNEFSSIKLREFYVGKSRGYLEMQFNRFVNDLYMKSLAGLETRSGKAISIIDKIMNFINLTLKDESNRYKIPNLSIINGSPIWAVLFYCLRGGFKQEALEFMKQYEDSFNKIEKQFPTYLREYLENGRVSSKTWGRMNNEFNQYFKLSSDVDPFKVVMYKLIGKLDLSKKSVAQLPLSIEDWTWLQLTLINESDLNNGEILSERYSLGDLQRNILEFGEQSFNSSSMNPVYLQTLVLVGLNEEAVKYYMKIDEIDAIHLAIVFKEYGILRTCMGSEYKLLNKSSEGFSELDFNQLIGYYVKFFKFSDPVVSAEYVLLMNDTKLALSCIKELILESNEFVLLLGKIDHMGRRHGGVLEKRRVLLGLGDISGYLQEICESGARKFEFEGKIINAISLYQLSEQYDTVLKLVNNLLVDSDGSVEALKIGYNLKSIYEVNSEIRGKVSGSSFIDLEKLLKVFELNERLNNGGGSGVLNEIGQLGMIPLREECEMVEIKKLAMEMNEASECIQKVLPKVLGMVIPLIRGRRVVINNMMIFCGLVDYKMPRDVYSRMVEMVSQ